MPRRKDNHLHKYKRTVIGKNGYTVYRCMLPACSHYIRKELLEGKICECNRCGNPMIMDKLAMTLAKPHCHDCTRRKTQDVDKIKKLIETLESSA